MEVETDLERFKTMLAEANMRYTVAVWTNHQATVVVDGFRTFGIGDVRPVEIDFDEHGKFKGMRGQP